MSTRFNLDGFGILGIVGGLASLGWAAYQTYKHDKLDREVRDKLAMSLDSIASKSAIDVEKSIVDNAIERAVEKKTDAAAAEGVAAVKADMHGEITKRVKHAVEEKYKDLSEAVAEKLAEQVESISEDALANRVIPRVEDKLMKRGESMLQKVQDTQMQELKKSMDFIGGVKNAILSGTGLGGNSNNNNGRSINLNL